MLTMRPYRRLRSQDSENSLLPVIPDGRRISTSAISAPSRTSLEPSGSVSLKPMCTVFSASPRNESTPLTSSAPTTAPHRLAHSADHEHRERDEGQLEVELVGGDAAELVDEEPAGEGRERAAQREGDEPLAIDVDPARLRRGRILAGRAQLAPEAAALVAVRAARR